MALLSALDEDYESVQSSSSNAVYFKSRDKGHNHTYVRHTEITPDLIAYGAVT